MTTRVWLSALRRGVAHHTIDGRHTTCRRYIGEPIQAYEVLSGHTKTERGWMVLQTTAERDYATRPCARCYGTAEIVTPTVSRSRDRRSA
jgi:hypothetical protein